MSSAIWVCLSWVKFISMTKFIDTHCHGIPAVDDGVQSDESALIMLKQAVESQIRLVFMTPHVIKDGKFFPSKALLQRKLNDLKKMINDNELPIEVKLGCEIMITEDGVKMIQDKDYWGYQDTDYVLIEFMPPFEEKLMQAALNELKSQGKGVIIAHPERYFSDPKTALKQVKTWKSEGIYLSLNKTSLFATKKASTRLVAKALLEANLIDLVATDAHHAPGRRECRLKEAHQELTRLYGLEAADRLCIHNPKLLSENKAFETTRIPNHPWARLVRSIKFRQAQ